MAVQFNFQKPARLQNRVALKGFIKAIFQEEGRQLSNLGIIFCDDLFLLEINRSHLNHDYFTDIVTFDLTEAGFKAINAEIYISCDRVKENAEIFGTSFDQELHRVIFHGILHLCGYKDRSKVQKAVIRNKENYYLEKYGLC